VAVVRSLSHCYSWRRLPLFRSVISLAACLLHIFLREQRWSPTALPGHPASHGCIRLPYDFAERLFDVTKLGVRVIVAPNEVQPVAIAHPVLFRPNPDAAANAARLATEADLAASKADQARVAAGSAYQLLNPETDAPAKVLIEHFQIDPGNLPIVLCPDGQLLRNPNDNELARYLGLVRPIDPDRLYDVAVVGAGPAGLGYGRLCGIG
jgi:hypothetical protein